MAPPRGWPILCFSALLCLVALPWTAGQPGSDTIVACSQTFNHSCSGDICNYYGYYEVQSDDYVYFTITALTGLGTWVGIGFSDDQMMTNSDVVVGAVDEFGFFVEDRYIGSVRTQPSIDDESNIANYSAFSMNGTTTISFRRPRISSDPDDRSLDTPFYILCAWSGVANTSTRNIGYHDSNRSPSSSRYMLPSADNCTQGPTFPTDTPSPPTCFDGELSFTSDGTNFTDVGAVFTGTVLVCNNGTFGAVCTQGWDDIDARVACQNRRFNFPDYMSFATQVEYNGFPEVVLQDVQCNGTEFSLAQCGGPGVGFTDSNCSFPMFIAGVRCQEAPRPIDIQCNVTSNFDQTVYFYSCGVIVNEGQQDTLECTVDGVPGEQCLLVDSIDVFDFAPGLHTATITVNNTLGDSDSESFFFFTPVPCVDGDFRVTNQSYSMNSTTQTFTAVVEVCYNGTYGAICPLGWDDDDARVICEYTNHSSFSNYVASAVFFMRQNADVVLEDVMCNGTERNPSECSFGSPLGDVGTECVFTDMVAGVRCEQTFGPPPCFDGDLSFMNDGSNFTDVGEVFTGTVLVCNDGTFGAVCAQGWDDIDARVACQYRGFNFPDYTSFATQVEYNGFPEVVLQDVQCNGTEFNLAECDGPGVGFTDSNCSFPMFIAGVRCQQVPLPIDIQCNVTSNFEQTVYSYSCGVIVNEGELGTLVCTVDGVPGEPCLLEDSINVFDFAPGGHNATITAINTLGNSDSASFSFFTPEITNCTDGQLRLRGGFNSTEGRVEICFNQTWGTVCDDDWDMADAVVACRQLGLPTSGAQAFDNARFGEGVGPIFLDDVGCMGTESQLTECPHPGIGVNNCGHMEDAGVSCSVRTDIPSFCTDGELYFDNENTYFNEFGEEVFTATVFVCNNGTFGAVCAQGWDDIDARVACQNRGFSFPDYISTATQVPYFGDPEVVLQDVRCSGTEFTLTECFSLGVNVDSNCNFPIYIAGVQCQRACPEGALQLGNFTTDVDDASRIYQQGRVQVCMNGTYGAICDVGWDDLDAQVVCRNLGYDTPGFVAAAVTGFPRNGSILFQDVSCNGTEFSPGECPYQPATDPQCFTDNSTAGVRCTEVANCTDGQIRLRGGFNSSEGRVEICFNQTWGTVCDDDWDMADAVVTCRQLGLPTSGAQAFESARFGEGVGPIFLDDVGCMGTESQLTECPHPGIGVNNCGHMEDAGVSCSVRTDIPSFCTDGELYFDNENTYFNEFGEEVFTATVFVCNNGTFGAVCAQGWDDIDARVACQNRGFSFPDYISTATQVPYFGDPEVVLQDVRCSGTEFTLTECFSLGVNVDSNCNFPIYIAGVQCQRACPEGALQLGNFTTDVDDASRIYQQGRVQVCMNGTYGAICDVGWDDLDAQVVCRNLGYDTPGFVATAVTGFPRNGTVLFQDVSCNGTEFSPGECPYQPATDPQCFTDNSTAGVRCTEVANCTDGQIRLRGGFNSTEGRVEICFNQTWGTVCDDDWDMADAVVTCRQLGLPTSGAQAFDNARFGEGVGPIFLDDVGCSGNESQLTECPHPGIGVNNCGHMEDAGVSCSGQTFPTDTPPPPTCFDGELSFVNDGTNFTEFGTVFTGTVLVCNNGTFGAVCTQGWDNIDARIACENRGFNFPDYTSFATEVEYFGTPEVVLQDVQCNGTEFSLAQCGGPGVGFTDSNCSFPMFIAGVRCQQAPRPIDIQCNITTNFDQTVYFYSCGVIVNEGQQDTLVCTVDGVPGEQCLLVDSINVFDFAPGGHNATITVNNTLGDSDSESFFFFTPAPCVDGDFRVTNQSYSSNSTTQTFTQTFTAVVEVCYNGMYGVICPLGWDDNDARVICEYTNHSSFSNYVASAEFFMRQNADVVLENVMCNGTERNPSECSFGSPLGDVGTDCVFADVVAGVRCEQTILPPTCNDGDLSFVDENTNFTEFGEVFTGTVLVCDNGTFGAVCAQGWDDIDARVACQYRGFFFPDYTSFATEVEYNGFPEVVLQDVQCNGTEFSLAECGGPGVGFTDSNCRSPMFIAGVRCQQETSICTDGQLRLRNGSTSTEGRVEICFNQTWGTVCDDDWDMADAVVTCRQLGLPTFGAQAFRDARFGAGVGPIFLDDVGCSGNESRLADCPHPGIGINNCNHGEDAGVNCSASIFPTDTPPPPTCLDGDLSFINDSTNFTEFGTVFTGTVLVCSGGTFGAVCAQGWDDIDARVACQRRGFFFPNYISTATRVPYLGSPEVVLQDVQCSGAEFNLVECPSPGLGFVDSNCSSPMFIAGVQCQEAPPPVCTDGTLRLANSTEFFINTEFFESLFVIEGRVEICYQGINGTVCDLEWDDRDAEVVCQELGYGPPSYVAEAIPGSAFGGGNGNVLERVGCNGTDFSQYSIFNDCQHPGLGNISEECNTLSRAAGVRCTQVPGPCMEDEVRVALYEDGTTEEGNFYFQGRVQVCVNGTFGAICDSGWDDSDAAVVCRSFGNDAPFYVATAITGLPSNITTYFQNVECIGNEISPFDCPYMPATDPQCNDFSANRSAGVRCTRVAEQCFRNGDIQLGNSEFVQNSNGSFYEGGRIEVCYNGTYGSVCDRNWDDLDAQVVCNFLYSFDIYEGIALSGSPYGVAGGNIVLQDVMCTGSESNLTACASDGLGFVDEECGDSSRAAGVICMRTCRENAVRLVGGSNRAEGTVELCRNNEWGTICDEGWDSLDANVTCSNLEFFWGGDPVYGAFFGEGGGMVVDSGFQCNGTEFYLNDCSRDPNPRPADCTHARDAGVICQPAIIRINLTDSGDAIAGFEDYTLYCNAESPTPANFTSFSWSNSEGIVTSDDRINITLLNATYDDFNEVFVFNSTLQFRTLVPSDADNWTCSITLDLTLAGINYTNSSSIPIAIEVDSPLVLINIVGEPVNDSDVDAVCTAQFYPGVPLEAVRIRWFDGDGIEAESDLPRVEVGSVEQQNETHFSRQVSLRPTILEDTDNYTCVAFADGDLLFSGTSSAFVEFIVELPANIVMPPVDITVNVTDAATFTCAAAGVPLPFISWTLPNGTQISLDSTSDGSPIFVLTDISDESPIVVVSMLIIESVVPGDAGEYTCTAVNPRDTVSETATLTVQEPATILVPPQDATVNETDPVMFTCSVRGVPLPFIVWTLPDGSNIDSPEQSRVPRQEAPRISAETSISDETPYEATSILFIDDVTRDDEGDYICTAVNQESASETATLTVQVPPVVLADNRTLLGLETQSITIGFSIFDASPPVQTSDIRWFFLPCIADEPSVESNFTDITEQALIGETVLSFSESRLELTLSGLTQDAAGIYRLEATNPAGMDSDYTNLTIQAVPRVIATSDDQFVTLTAEQPQAPVTFSCSVYAIPRIDITWTYSINDNEPIVVESGIEQMIAGYVTNSTLSFDATVDDRGTLVCSAENVHGAIEESISLVVYVVPDDVILNGTEGDIPEGAEIQLQCFVSESWPRPSLTWRRDDVMLLNSSRLQIETNTYQTDSGLYRAASSLTISSSLPSDTGVYYCEVDIDIPEVTIPPVSVDITVTMAAPSNIELPPRNITVNESDAATFTCSVSGVPLPSIVWTLPSGDNLESVVLNGQDIEQAEIYAETVVSEEMPYAATSTLSIDPVSRNDDGIYTCTAINRIANATASATLTVQVPPVVLAENRILLGLEQESLTIRFSIVDAAPPVQVSNIRWFFTAGGMDESNAIDITEQTAIGETVLTFSVSLLELTISSITQEASGIYTLVATNPAGTGSNFTDLEMVQAAPRFAFPLEDQVIVLTADQPQADVIFSCSAYAIPVINITWTYFTLDGVAQVLSNTVERIDIAQEREEFITTSTLMISNATFADRGVFMCDAGNEHGDIFANASLTVFVVPDTLTLNGTEGEIIERAEIRLQCSLSQGWPQPMLVWLRDDVELSDDPRVQITPDISMTQAGLYVASSILYIPSSLPSDSGTYTCRPDIDIPDTTIPPRSVFITVTMREPATSIVAPLAITVNETDSATFTCSVSGVPLPSITWTLPDGSNITAVDQQSEILPRVFAETFTSEEAPYEAMSILTITSASRIDEGVYTCNAVNDDSMTSSTGTLTVQVPPAVLADAQQVLGLEQEDTMISFSINNASPLVQTSAIRWLFIANTDDLEIDITEADRLGETVLTFSESRLELTLSGLTQDAEGIYRLVATNPAGTASNYTNLTIQAAPRFVDRPEDQQLTLSRFLPFGSLTLMCNVYAIPAATITWMHIPSDEVTDSQERMNIQENREGYVTFSTLTLSEVTFADRGEFICTAENEHNTINSTASLTVYVVPALILTGTSGDIIEETAIQLQCSITEGWPRPMLVWSRDDVEIANSSRIRIESNVYETDNGLYLASSNLTIPSSVPDDSGRYNCSVEIDIPDVTVPPMSVSITVAMREPATILVPPLDATVNETDPVMFTCSVRGVPLPFIAWTLPDGSNIDGRERVRRQESPRISVETSISDETPYEATSVLFIDDVTRDDEGDYICTAVNQESASETATLTVQVLPVVEAENPSLLRLEGDNVTIRFSIFDASPMVQTSAIRWLFIADTDGLETDITEADRLGETVLTFSESRLELTLSGLTQDAEGIYRLVATNPAGTASNYTNLTIQAAPRFVDRPEDQQIILSLSSPIGSLTLMCNVYAIPAATITWMHIPSDEVTDSQERMNIQENREGYVTFSTLMLSDVTFADRGEFICTAENEHNAISSTASLVVFVVPDLTLTGTTGDIVEETAIELQCSLTEAWPMPELALFMDDTPIINSTSRLQFESIVFTTEEGLFVASLSLTINSSIPEDSSLYSCRADIEIPDTVIPTESVSIIVTQRAPATIVLPPEDTTVNATDQAMFACGVAGVPLPSIVWTLPDGSNLESLVFNEQDLPRRESRQPAPANFAETTISDETPYAATSVLYINSVSPDDEGEYICTATNDQATVEDTAVLTVQVPPNVLAENRTLLALEEDSVTIRFSIQDASPDVLVSNIRWFFILVNEDPIDITDEIAIGDTTLMYSESRLELTLSGLTQDAAGIYRLEATNPAGVDSDYTNLTIQARATIEVPPRDTTVNVTDNAIFTCGVAGIPLPFVTWTLPDGSNLNQETEGPIFAMIDISEETPYEATSTLIITSASPENEGEYTCVAENVHDSVRDSASLTVQVPPVVLAENRTRLGLEEESITIRFSIINASPEVLPSNIRWFFLEDGGNASADFRDITESNMIGSTQLSFSDPPLALTLSGLTQEAAGLYRLVATNPAGINSDYTNLTIEAAPRFVAPPRNQFVIITSDSPQGSITLICRVYAIPLADITWTYRQENSDAILILDNSVPRFEINESTDGYTTTSTLTFTEIVFGDSGEFECMAENVHAISSSAASLTVFVIPDALVLDGTAGQITEGDEITLQCTAPPTYPSPTVVWLRDTTVLFPSSRIQLQTVVNQNEEGLFVASSSLTIPTSIPDDSGRYICRADVTVPGTTIPPVDVTITVAARNECVPNPCVNGACIDRIDSFFCVCNEGFIGTNCDEQAVVPSIPVIIQPPANTTVRLGERVNLTCISEGVPAPTYTWFRDSVELVDETLPYLLITSAAPSNRGFYICTVSNSEGTVGSDPILLSMRGVRQYAASFAIEPPDNRVKRQSGNENLDNLIDQLRGRAIGDTGVTIFDATVESYDPETNDASLLLTLSSGSDSDSFPSGLTGNLGGELTAAGESIGIEIQAMIIRFDGCPEEDAVGYSWPETDLGFVAMVSCICGNIDTAEISRLAVRECAGSFAEGATWNEPDISQCQFSDAAVQLCDASTLDEEDAIIQVSVITEVTTDLNSVDISIAVDIITRPDVITTVVETPDVIDDFLSAIDNVLLAGDEDVQQSQEDSNSSTLLLETIEEFQDIVPLPPGETEVTYPEETFILVVQETPVDEYSGMTFELDIDINIQVGFDENSVSSSSGAEAQAGTSLIAPESILEDAGITSGQNGRLSYNVFSDDTLFQPRPEFQAETGMESFAVGSVIQSLTVAGSSDSRLQLSNPVRMRFQKTREAMENGTNPMCVFWDPDLDGGFGGFSEDGCSMVSDTAEYTECECDHLTSFCIILDVAPRPQEDLGVEIITYIGLGISIIALIITIATYLIAKKLRASVNGQLLVNLSLALLGLFVVFIISAQGQDKLGTGGCGFFSALLHYFLLAYFFWTAAEALYLYFKLVKVFMGQSFFFRNYTYIAMLVAWITPLVIVGISLGGYQFYGSSSGGDDDDDEVNFCRPYQWPFYFGFIVPFVLIYIFNWIMFIVIMFSLCRQSAKAVTTDAKSIVTRQLFIAMALSLLFGLGWAFGLIGSSSLPRGASITGQYIFSIFIGFQGVLIFILHAVRSADAREEWKRWWYTLTCRTEQYRIYRTTSITTSSKRGTTKTRATRATRASGTSPSDSFHMGSFSQATPARDDVEKQPLSSEEEKKPDDVPLEVTTVALDFIVENPLAKATEEEPGMEEKGSRPDSPSPTDAIAITLSVEAADEDTTTKL